MEQKSQSETSDIEQQKRISELRASAQAQAQYIKQANDSVIDFHSQMRIEKNLALEKLQFKQTNAMNAYNMLQDLRHLIILDFRNQEEFNQSHIRKSIKVDLTDYQKTLASALVSLHLQTQPGAEVKSMKKSQSESNIIYEGKKAMRSLEALDQMLDGNQKINGKVFASQYKGDDLKRVLFIFPEDQSQQKIIEKQIQKELQVLADEILTHSKERLSKAFFLKEYNQFSKKYPLLCVPSPCSNELQGITSLSRFPSEIKKDFVYIGNLTNVLSKDYQQLKMLGIKTIIHFTPERFEHLEKEFACIHYEVRHLNKDIELNFEEIIQQIVELQQQKEPIFIFCINGFLSGAIATQYVMHTNKAFNKELAVAYVMNKRYELKDMPSWLYSMIK